MVLPAPMAPRFTSLLAALLLASVLVASSIVPSHAGNLDLGSFTLTSFNPTSNCVVDGVVGDCLDDDDEMVMESETARRVLAATRGRFISYGALQKDRVPCNRRGQSYYNCASRGRANPYRRSCTAITRCKRDLS